MDFVNVSTTGLESSLVAAALAGLRAHEAGYFKNKYDLLCSRAPAILALIDAGLAGDDRLRQVLHDYFSWATTTAMARYPHSAEDVPDGLGVPHWSWDGLVSTAAPTGGS